MTLSDPLTCWFNTSIINWGSSDPYTFNKKEKFQLAPSFHIKSTYDPRELKINTSSNKVFRLQQTACNDYREAAKHNDHKSDCQTVVNLSACGILSGICTDVAGHRCPPFAGYTSADSTNTLL